MSTDSDKPQPKLNTEQRLCDERRELITRLEQIDRERQYLKRQAWRVERLRDGKRKAAPMKREGTTLFTERGHIRERLGEVNRAIKELHRAGVVGQESIIATAFMNAAKEVLDSKLYEEILNMAVLRSLDGNEA